MQDYEQLKNEILEKIDLSSTLDRLEDVRVKSLGKKGSLSLLMKQLGSIEPDKRRETGQKLNLIQKEVLEASPLQTADFEIEGSLSITYWTPFSPTAL